jgi:hypothetical protein
MKFIGKMVWPVVLLSLRLGSMRNNKRMVWRSKVRNSKEGGGNQLLRSIPLVRAFILPSDSLVDLPIYYY